MIINPVKHIAIIMDGNGRWAEEHHVPRAEGHAAGARKVEEVLNMVKKYDIKYVTLYAFSTENWKRSREEVDALMALLLEFLHSKFEEMKKEKIRLLVTGRLSGMPVPQKDALEEVIAGTSKNYERTLILALNYGGRAEIADAAKKIAIQVKNGSLDPENITEETVSKNLYLPDVPDPDIMIRTAGELRLSNFLLWELSYAEFFITKVYWPDFSEEILVEILNEYSKRDRRFGGRNKK